MRISAFGLVVVSLVASAPLAIGQTPPAKDRPVIKVTLEPWESVPGRLAMYRRTATPAGDRLLVEGLDMLTPVIVAVQADDPASVIHLGLYKDGVKDPVRSATTNAQGAVGMDFRTYGEVGIDVRAETSAPYLLAVWAAPPREVSVPSPFVVGRAGGLPVWTWTAGGAALLVLGAFAFVFWNRKRSAVRAAGTGTAMLAMLALGTSLAAQPNGKDFSDKLLNQGVSVRDNGKILPLAPQTLPNKPNPPMTAPDFGRAKDLWNLFNGVRGVAKYGGLGPDDRLYEPQLGPDGMPKVPLSCADQGACGHCFAQAYGSLTDVRKKLENNRIVLLYYHRRIERIDTAAKAVAGLGMTAGFLYQQEKAKWDAEVASVEGSYDGHYTQLMEELQKALRAIEQCELEHNGYRDWYNRAGFMYYEFMAGHYHR